MEVKIYPPLHISSSPFIGQWYNLRIEKLSFDVSQKIHEYNITAKNKFTMTGYEHSVSKVTLSGVISIDSDLPGATLEEKKDNLVDAASGWWFYGDQKNQTECAKLYCRGWEFYIMIERLSIERTAGDTEAYYYELIILILEG